MMPATSANPRSTPTCGPSAFALSAGPKQPHDAGIPRRTADAIAPAYATNCAHATHAAIRVNKPMARYDPISTSKYGRAIANGAVIEGGSTRKPAIAAASCSGCGILTAPARISVAPNASRKASTIAGIRARFGPYARVPLSATESLSRDGGTTYNRRMVRRAAVALLVLLAACSGRSTAPDFTLTSDSGAPWELAQQRSIVVLTFGFAHCADTCPALLARLSRIAANTERTHGKPVHVAMVTVDPDRDRPATLHAFVSQFAGVTGLTGTQAQIDAVETAYHVWAQRLPLKHGAYDYAHATAIYVIDANGRIAGVHDDTDSDATLASSIDAASAA
jgi:cytochrome oxidase Cu insertion factor (SCO1/SenC/PrrC family)